MTVLGFVAHEARAKRLNLLCAAPGICDGFDDFQAQPHDIHPRHGHVGVPLIDRHSCRR